MGRFAARTPPWGDSERRESTELWLRGFRCLPFSLPIEPALVPRPLCCWGCKSAPLSPPLRQEVRAAGHTQQVRLSSLGYAFCRITSPPQDLDLLLRITHFKK